LNLDINKLFDDVYIRNHSLDEWERKNVISTIMRLRKLLNARTDFTEEHYSMAEDKTLIHVLNELLELYGILFFNSVTENK
jgi:predicted component of type VI protein secretion system